MFTSHSGGFLFCTQVEVNSGMRMPNVTNSTIDALAGDWTPEVTVKSLV
jgi:hypothetical protein